MKGPRHDLFDIATRRLDTNQARAVAASPAARHGTRRAENDAYAASAMNTFRVVVRTVTHSYQFHALGVSSASVAAAAERMFDVCCVTVHPVSRP